MKMKPWQWRKQPVHDELLLSMRLSDDAALAYHRLILQYRLHDGHLPDDDKLIANLVHFSTRRWKKVRAELESEFDIVDGRWRHEAEDREIADSKRRCEERTKSARHAAEARWNLKK